MAEISIQAAEIYQVFCSTSGPEKEKVFNTNAYPSLPAVQIGKKKLAIKQVITPNKQSVCGLCIIVFLV